MIEEIVLHATAMKASIYQCAAVTDKCAERARVLLMDHLNPSQRRQYNRTGLFVVRGRSGLLYVLGDYSVHAFVNTPFSADTHYASLCIRPNEWVPNDDVALTLKTMIETDEYGTWVESPLSRPSGGDLFDRAVEAFKQAGGPPQIDQSAIEIEFSPQWVERAEQTVRQARGREIYRPGELTNGHNHQALMFISHRKT